MKTRTMIIKIQVKDYKYTKPSTFKIVMALSLSFNNAATLPADNAVVEKDGDVTYAVLKRYTYTDNAYEDTMSALAASGFAIVIEEDGKEVKKFEGRCMSVEQAYERDDINARTEDRIAKTDNIIKETDDIIAKTNEIIARTDERIREIERENEFIRALNRLFDRENAYLEASHRCIERIYNKHNQKEES